MSYKKLTLKEFEEWVLNELFYHVFTRNTAWQVCLRVKWEQWESGTSFLVGDTPPTNDIWNNWDTYLDYNNHKLYFKNDWVWSDWVDFWAWWFTWLVEDSTWNIIWRWENWLLKDPYYPSPITGWIWMMQIWNDFVVS